MKAFKHALLAAALTFGCLVQGCSGGTSQETTATGSSKSEATGEVAQTPKQTPKVYIASIVEHPALDAVRDGVVDFLGEKGYKRDENLVVRFGSAQGNTSIAGQMAKQYAAEDPDVVVAIGTPMAQAMVAATSTTPIVYSAITDPLAAKLVDSWDPSGTNVTGVSDELPLDKQMDLMQDMVKDLKHVGYIYSSGEMNSTVVLDVLKEELPKRGIELVAVAAPRTSDIPSAARSLAGKVELIYTSLDNNVVSAYESLVQAAQEMRIPLLASDEGSVSRGAVMCLGVNYHDVGRRTGQVVLDIIEGAKPGDIPSTKMDSFDLHVNVANGAQLGYEVPEFLLERADFIDGEPNKAKAGGEEAPVNEPAAAQDEAAGDSEQSETPAEPEAEAAEDEAA